MDQVQSRFGHWSFETRLLDVKQFMATTVYIYVEAREELPGLPLARYRRGTFLGERREYLMSQTHGAPGSRHCQHHAMTNSVAP